jgi:hypothetical protein
MKTATATIAASVVTAIELASIQRDRAALEALKLQAKALSETLDEREVDAVARIEGGVQVDGQATVISRRRQNISWLTIVKRELGEAMVIKVKDEWPVTFYEDLQIA